MAFGLLRTSFPFYHSKQWLAVVLIVISHGLLPLATGAEFLVSAPGLTLTVEVTDTAAGRVSGLSGRSSLPPRSGMLFDFKRMALPGIWMKDMRFALDIVWLDEHGRVVSKKSNVQPETFPEIFTPTQPARYVLEVAPGSGIRQGQTLSCALRTQDPDVIHYPDCHQAIQNYRALVK